MSFGDFIRERFPTPVDMLEACRSQLVSAALERYIDWDASNITIPGCTKGSKNVAVTDPESKGRVRINVFINTYRSTRYSESFEYPFVVFVNLRSQFANGSKFDTVEVNCISILFEYYEQNKLPEPSSSRKTFVEQKSVNTVSQDDLIKKQEHWFTKMISAAKSKLGCLYIKRKGVKDPKQLSSWCDYRIGKTKNGFFTAYPLSKNLQNECFCGVERIFHGNHMKVFAKNFDPSGLFILFKDGNTIHTSITTAVVQEGAADAAYLAEYLMNNGLANYVSVAGLFADNLKAVCETLLLNNIQIIVIADRGKKGEEIAKHIDQELPNVFVFFPPLGNDLTEMHSQVGRRETYLWLESIFN